MIYLYCKDPDGNWVRRYVGPPAPELKAKWDRCGIEYFESDRDLGAVVREKPEEEQP